ncbi:hypothetical protein HU200_005029 [Digitaria exilis]|uniref:Uncharacterized protein n=1 Tax=Digitaria exilis TaxID=1010633 RepID=A0A835KUI5_9POAL|nr:hypothetical protein HU200_005029 [Digitaria exilis]
MACCNSMNQPANRSRSLRRKQLPIEPAWNQIPDMDSHTAAVAVTWVIGNVRNDMIFNLVQQDTAAISQQLQAHIDIWTCQATRRLDVEPLKLWCQTGNAAGSRYEPAALLQIAADSSHEPAALLPIAAGWSHEPFVLINGSGKGGYARGGGRAFESQLPPSATCDLGFRRAHHTQHHDRHNPAEAWLHRYLMHNDRHWE